MDFQLLPTTSLDFQVALNLGETAPLIPEKMTFHQLGVLNCYVNQLTLFIVTTDTSVFKIRGFSLIKIRPEQRAR